MSFASTLALKSGTIGSSLPAITRVGWRSSGSRERGRSPSRPIGHMFAQVLQNGEVEALINVLYEQSGVR